MRRDGWDPAWQCGGQGFESPQLHPLTCADPSPQKQTRSAPHSACAAGCQSHDREAWPDRAAPRRGPIAFGADRGMGAHPARFAADPVEPGLPDRACCVVEAGVPVRTEGQAGRHQTEAHGGRVERRAVAHCVGERAAQWCSNDDHRPVDRPPRGVRPPLQMVGGDRLHVAHLVRCGMRGNRRRMWTCLQPKSVASGICQHDEVRIVGIAVPVGFTVSAAGASLDR
jgi:hypothetical protein